MPSHDCLASVKEGIQGLEPVRYSILDILRQFSVWTGLLEQTIQPVRHAFYLVYPSLNYIWVPDTASTQVSHRELNTMLLHRLYLRSPRYASTPYSSCSLTRPANCILVALLVREVGFDFAGTAGIPDDFTRIFKLIFDEIVNALE
jgi:hypothetical protein